MLKLHISDFILQRINFANLVYNNMSQKDTDTKMFALSSNKFTVQTSMHILLSKRHLLIMLKIKRNNNTQTKYCVQWAGLWSIIAPHIHLVLHLIYHYHINDVILLKLQRSICNQWVAWMFERFTEKNRT